MLKGKRGEKIEFKKNMQLYWKVARPYKWSFITIIFIVLIVESLGLLEKFLFKVVIDKGSEFEAGVINSSSLTHALIIVAVVFLSSVVIRSAGDWLRFHLTIKQDQGIAFDLKNRFFNHIVGLAHRFHTTHKTGSMISRLNRGTAAVDRMSDLIIFNLAPIMLQVILVGASFLYFDLSTAIAVFATAIVFIFFSLYFITRSQEPNIAYNKSADREKGFISDAFTNIDSIKFYGREKTISNRFKKLSLVVQFRAITYANYFKTLQSGQVLIMGVGTFFVILFPILAFTRGDLTIGTVAFMYTTYGSLMGPLAGFVYGIRGFYRSMADFQELFKYEETQNEIIDKENAKNLSVKKGEIKMEDVSFSYNDRKIIDSLNLEIKPNEKVAIVGHSGSGKTTLVKLLYRMYDIQKGKISIDGLDIREAKQESLRSELSNVPQECVLFDDTIYNNILFSRPNASKEDVMNAMKFAQLDNFIKNLPKKEKTIVGERGVKLSGGEKQRVSIARAILANKKILVLDEATSALDSETEFEIQRDLEKLMVGRTSIIIAHRLSTIMRADKIVVMDKGKIAQIGKHKDLINKQGIYRKLWDLQKGGFIE